jgi:DNA-binding XRE family transcriptional regulator
VTGALTDVAAQPSRAGNLLREWRRRRRMSQLDLALEAGFSARHVSFIEAGRSRPSAEMVLQLASTRRSGTARSMTGLCPAGAFALTAGEEKLRIWDLCCSLRHIVGAGLVSCYEETRREDPTDGTAGAAGGEL